MKNQINLEQTTPAVTNIFSLQGYLNDWQHCSQLSDYLAQFVSTKQIDPDSFSNLLSTILNEVLESIYHYSKKDGNVIIDIYNQDFCVIVKAAIPVDQQSHSFYNNVLYEINNNNPNDLYSNELKRYLAETDSSTSHTAMGFYEIVSEYGAKIALHENKPDKITLSIQFCLK